MGAGKGKDAPEASSQAHCYTPRTQGDAGCGDPLPALGSAGSSSSLPILPSLEGEEGEGKSVEPEPERKAGQGRLRRAEL